MRGTTTIARFDDYGEAQLAVDALSDAGFPVERLAIVGCDLRSIEQVTGRKTYVTSAVGTAVGGGIVGSLLGFLLGLLSVVDPVVSSIALGLWGFAIGAVVGAVLGVVSHALSGGRRDFHSFGGVAASRYEVVCDLEHAAEAERMLGRVRHAAHA